MSCAPSKLKIKRFAILSLAMLVIPSCLGQDIARREGIHFRHSSLASFQDISPDNRLFREALEKALKATEIERTQLTSVPRVVKGSSFFVDPPYLGKTDYMRGLIFVWEGTEIPVEEVLLHEMIHWALYHSGLRSSALDEVYVSTLANAALEEKYDSELSPDESRWRDMKVMRRNMERHRRGVFDQDELNSWDLARQRERTYIPMHP